MPWSIVLLKTLIAQLTKKFPAFSKGSSLCKIQVSTVVNINVTVHWSPITLYAFIFSIHATWPTNLIIYLIILIMFVKKYKLRSSSVQFSPASYYLIPLGSKYSLQHLFPNTFSFFFSLNMWDQVPHSYKTTEQIIVFVLQSLWSLTAGKKRKSFWTELWEAVLELMCS
jgi:hypothetical protein